VVGCMTPPKSIRITMLLPGLAFLGGDVFCATEVQVKFTLNTIYACLPVTENRYYYLYRPENLPKTTPVPVVLVLGGLPSQGRPFLRVSGGRVSSSSPAPSPISWSASRRHVRAYSTAG
jgi:hypothetical protein